MENRDSFERRGSLLSTSTTSDLENFPETYDVTAPPVGIDMAGYDTYLHGPKTVLLDAFIVDLLDVDTSAQTFKLKMILNLDWEDDGTIEPETKAKRNLVRKNDSLGSDPCTSLYKTGKYVPRGDFIEDPLSTTWNPEVVLVNAISDGDPIEAGSKMHSVQMLHGRPVVSRKLLYQPECRCDFTYANFPFDETDLVIKFSSNKWSAEQLTFVWSERLRNYDRRCTRVVSAKTRAAILASGVDKDAIGGLGQSEFEIVGVKVNIIEKDVNSMQRYDNNEGAFSEAHLIISVRRDPYSYLIRVAFVSELLMILEVMSFLTDRDGLSDRFSISGTIFLAMVSLYGPMADALPKVSVVTRVDKWHLFNFVLLFASNIENLVVFMLRDTINESVLHFSELLLAGLYLYSVIKNSLWFVKPLSKRDEWDIVVDEFEAFIDTIMDKIPWGKAGTRAIANKDKRDTILKMRSDVHKMLGRSDLKGD